jgi:hypothetical protein
MLVFEVLIHCKSSRSDRVAGGDDTYEDVRATARQLKNSGNNFGGEVLWS